MTAHFYVGALHRAYITLAQIAYNIKGNDSKSH